MKTKKQKRKSRKEKAEKKKQKRNSYAFAVLFSLCLLFSLTACEQQTAQQPTQSASLESEPPAESALPSTPEAENGTLVVYFSVTAVWL